MFLVGKSIPEHIINLPRTFLETPFGQMMKPQIEMALKGVTQGTGPSINAGPSAQPFTRRAAPSTPQPAVPSGAGTVRVVSNLNQLESTLSGASDSCAVIFFTSATCPPCKAVYPTYDQLAAEAGERGTLIKVDISIAHDVSMKYSVRATPTFMTFVKGQKMDEWRGATPSQLIGNVRMLLEMAHPAHPHRQLRLPSLQRDITNFVMYKKAPPIDKLLQKLPVAFKEAQGVGEVIEFVKLRHSSVDTPAADVRVPDLHVFAKTLNSAYSTLPSDSHFAVVDLVRLLLLDPRASGYFAEEAQHATLLTLLAPLSQDDLSTPYNLRIVALQLACNLFSTPLYPTQITSSSSPLRETCLRFATNSLLDSHASLRVVAASFAYNLASFNHNARFEGKEDPLSEEDQVELTASLFEAVSREDQSVEALHGLLYALGLLVYEAPMDGAVVDLCRAMGVADTISGKMNIGAVQKEPLLKELGEELFSKGL
jgi:thiol-disulfide isomerase/thioredoxin